MCSKRSGRVASSAARMRPYSDDSVASCSASPRPPIQASRSGVRPRNRSMLAFGSVYGPLVS
jgi:hypothetical protein